MDFIMEFAIQFINSLLKKDIKIYNVKPRKLDYVLSFIILMIVFGIGAYPFNALKIMGWLVGSIVLSIVLGTLSNLFVRPSRKL